MTCRCRIKRNKQEYILDGSGCWTAEVTLVCICTRVCGQTLIIDGSIIVVPGIGRVLVQAQINIDVRHGGSTVQVFSCNEIITSLNFQPTVNDLKHD